MVEAKGRDAWNHTALLVAAVFNSNPFRTGPAVKPSTFHPYTSKPGSKAKAEKPTPAPVQALRWLFVDSPVALKPCSPSPPA